MIKSDEKLEKDFKILLTVPCIGEKLAWIILSEYYYVEPGEIRPKSCVAHAGLSPKHMIVEIELMGKLIYQE